MHVTNRRNAARRSWSALNAFSASLIALLILTAASFSFFLRPKCLLLGFTQVIGIVKTHCVLLRHKTALVEVVRVNSPLARSQ